MDYLAQAQCTAQVYDRQFKACKTLPDLCNLYANAVKVVRGLGGNLSESELEAVLGALAVSRDHANAKIPNLGAVPSGGVLVISPAQLDQIEQMMLMACVTAEELMAEFELQRICFMPTDVYSTAVAWIAECGMSRRGVEVKAPKADPEPVAPAKEKFDKQAWIDQMARHKGVSAPLLAILEMQNDMPQ